MRAIPLRISAPVTCPADVDRSRIVYQVILYHLSCISDSTWKRIVVEGGNGVSLFGQEIYFHPNVGVDGWVRTRERYELLFANTDFPPFPPTPRFWTHDTWGSGIGLWPPQFFHPWLLSIQAGVPLELEHSLLLGSLTAAQSHYQASVGLSGYQTPSPVVGPSPPPVRSHFPSMLPLTASEGSSSRSSSHSRGSPPPVQSQAIPSPPAGSEDGEHEVIADEEPEVVSD